MLMKITEQRMEPIKHFNSGTDEKGTHQFSVSTEKRDYLSEVSSLNFCEKNKKISFFFI